MGDSTDVLSVWYNNNDVFVETNGIPSYYGGLTWASSSAFSASAIYTIFRRGLMCSRSTGAGGRKSSSRTLPNRFFSVNLAITIFTDL